MKDLYEFKLTYDGITTSLIADADCDAKTLREYLRRFLYECTWDPILIDKIIVPEDEK